MLQHCNKIQVLTNQEMGWLKGICVACKSDRVLLACSSWRQLLIGFLDSVNFIRNSSLPIRNVKIPRSQLVWSSPPVIKMFTSHLPGPPVTAGLVKSPGHQDVYQPFARSPGHKSEFSQLPSPPVIKLVFSHLPGPPVISVDPRQLLSPPVIVPRSNLKLPSPPVI